MGDLLGSPRVAPLFRFSRQFCSIGPPSPPSPRNVFIFIFLSLWSAPRRRDSLPTVGVRLGRDRTRGCRRASSRCRTDGLGALGEKNRRSRVESGRNRARRRHETGLPVCPVDLLLPSFPTVYHMLQSGLRIESYGQVKPRSSAPTTHPEGSNSFIREYTPGAIIPALMHRIPSELRS